MHYHELLSSESAVADPSPLLAVVGPDNVSAVRLRGGL